MRSNLGPNIVRDRRREGATIQTIPASDCLARELAYRETEGLEVTLLWNAHNDRLTVSVAEARSGAFGCAARGMSSEIDLVAVGPGRAGARHLRTDRIRGCKA